MSGTRHTSGSTLDILLIPMYKTFCTYINTDESWLIFGYELTYILICWCLVLFENSLSGSFRDLCSLNLVLNVLCLGCLGSGNFEI